MEYLKPLTTAAITFPIIAFIITIPYMVSQYHRYGSINKLRTFIIYSFILYLMCCYMLIILPFPDKDVVLKGHKIQLIPFKQLVDFFKETSLVIWKPSTYLKALTDRCFYTVAFNYLMFVPFGIYLRYYFKQDLKHTALYAFLLSLFFELTQFTGLYFIYSGSYRLCDVDDLIVNTTGALLGFWLAKYISKLLPSRDKIDNASYRAGQTVSSLRRIVYFCLDLFFCSSIVFILSIYIKENIINEILAFVIYYCLLPLLFKGKTFAGLLLSLKVEADNHNYLRRTGFYLARTCYWFGIPFASLFIVDLFKSVAENNKELFFIVCCFVAGFICLFYLINFILFIKNKLMFYDHKLQIQFVSTVVKKSEKKK